MLLFGHSARPYHIELEVSVNHEFIGGGNPEDRPGRSCKTRSHSISVH